MYAYAVSASNAVLASAADSAVDLVSQLVISWAEVQMRRADPRYPVGQARLEAIGVLVCEYFICFFGWWLCLLLVLGGAAFCAPPSSNTKHTPRPNKTTNKTKTQTNNQIRRVHHVDRLVPGHLHRRRHALRGRLWRRAARARHRRRDVRHPRRRDGAQVCVLRRVRAAARAQRLDGRARRGPPQR